MVLHDDNDYKEWLVELKERFYNHRLKASCATNNYVLDFYWKLGRDIEAKQYANTYGSGFYKSLSQDLKEKMPGVKGFSPTNLKYMSYFYKLYASLTANRRQPADDFRLLFMIPWDHHCRIISRCKGDMDKACSLSERLGRTIGGVTLFSIGLTLTCTSAMARLSLISNPRSLPYRATWRNR